MPVVEHSEADALYAGLPVLIIEDVADLSATWLKEKHANLAPLFEVAVPEELRGVPGVAWLPAFRPPRLQPMTWQHEIEQRRDSALLAHRKPQQRLAGPGVGAAGTIAARGGMGVGDVSTDLGMASGSVHGTVEPRCWGSAGLKAVTGGR